MGWVFPILAAVAGFTGTMYVMGKNRNENPTEGRGERSPWKDFIFRWEWLVDQERQSAKRLRNYELAIELLSHPEALRERKADGDWYQYEIVDNIVKGGFRSGHVFEIERKDSAALKPMISTMLSDPNTPPKMIKVLKDGRQRAKEWSSDASGVMQWARGIGEHVYFHSEKPIPKPPKVTSKLSKEALGYFEKALARLLDETSSLPPDKAKNVRSHILNFTNTN
jgi:hypothetical protein